jgi:uncharacterized membrane protein YdjX (TVP38/TMEM64 family)
MAALVAAFFAFGLYQHLTLESLKARYGEIVQFYEARPVAALAGFFMVYVLVATTSLPGGAAATMTAGALFGTVTATIVVSFASAIGATLAFLAARYVFRDAIERRFGGRLREGVERDGAFYLFLLRLVPLVPFFVVNAGMGLTRIRTWTYYWVSQLGMLAGTFLFANAGARLAAVQSPWDVLTPGVLTALAVLGAAPLAARILLRP